MLMKLGVKLSGLIVVAASAVTLAPGAGGGALGPQTTEPTEIINVRVTITDARISVSERTVERGVALRFVIRNAGKKVHNFAMGERPELDGFHTPNLTRGKSAVLLVFMDYRGDFPYKSTVRGDLNKPGMRGHITVL
jgi:uncharacterized cupredoxin-like copper-binding protein